LASGLALARVNVVVALVHLTCTIQFKCDLFQKKCRWYLQHVVWFFPWFRIWSVSTNYKLW